MKFITCTLLCFFSLQIFAQQDHSMMDMKMDDSSYLPFVITHSVIKSWGANNLFQTELDPSTLVYLKGEREHTITIKAFQQKFYDDPKVLKPVWVLGYVSNESNAVPSLPGPVILSNYNRPTKIFWVNKVYETLKDQSLYKLYPIYDSASKQHPFVPIIYNVNDPMHVPMIADVLYPDFRQFPNGVDPMHEKIMDVSTYYSTTVHLHGANVTWQNDGYPTSKYYPTPGAKPVNITWGLFGKFEQNKTGQHYVYPNTFPEGAFSFLKSKMENVPFSFSDSTQYEGHHGGILWYHDHAMMRTATNVYSGMVGIYLIKGEDENAFSSSVKYQYDLPLILADKSFTESNYLYYNTTTSPPGVPNKAPEVEGQPEFTGNTITVNGKIWPYMNVTQSIYRFRILNASNTRFYRLAIAKWENGKIDTSDNAKLSKNFIQVGTEGGFFPDGNFPTIGNDSSALTLAPSERADVLINFSSFKAGTSLVVLNYAPDAPFGDDGLIAINADSTFDDLTNYVMLFRIGDSSNSNKVTEEALKNGLSEFSSSPIYQKTTSSNRLYSYYKNDQQFKADLQNALNKKFNDGKQAQGENKNALSSMFPKEAALLDNADTFRLTINEAANYSELPKAYKNYLESNPMLVKDMSFPMAFLNSSEWNLEAHTSDTLLKRYEKTVSNYTTEIWAITNNSDDAHPIHLHLNRFRILGRQKVDAFGNPLPGAGNFSLPEPNEMAWKDVVRAKPHYINYILVQFILNDSTQEGQFVYHCHILEHEDMSMMRRLVVLPGSADKQYFLALKQQ